MFCPKCGAELIGGAKFCQKCGARADVPAASAEILREDAASQPTAAPVDRSKKQKKSRKAPVMILLAVVLVVIAGVFISMNWDPIDYVATAKAYQPFANSQGLPYTCEEVLDKYLVSAQWEELEPEGDLHYVKISGTAKGTERKLAFTIQIVPNPDDPDGCLFTPCMASVDGETTTDTGEVADFLYLLFAAYDQKEEDLSVLLADPMELAFDAYRNIVSQADSYDYSGGYGEPNPPDATYYYALVPMSAGSDIPALLLSSYNEFFGLNYIRVFQYDAASGTVLEPEDVLMEGVATAGGFRGVLSMMDDGYGLNFYYGSSGSGEAAIERITLEGNELFYTTEWTGMFGDTLPTDLYGVQLVWYDVQDGSGLEY